MPRINGEVIIKSKRWYNKNKDKNGIVIVDNCFKFTKEMSKYCGKVAHIENYCIDLTFKNSISYSLDICPNLKNHKKYLPWTEHMFCNKSKYKKILEFIKNNW